MWINFKIRYNLIKFIEMNKVLDWIRRTFIDDKGEPSSKRQMAFLTFVLFVYAVIADKDQATLNAIITLIVSLLGITGIEKFRKNK